MNEKCNNKYKYSEKVCNLHLYCKALIAYQYEFETNHIKIKIVSI